MIRFRTCWLGLVLGLGGFVSADMLGDEAPPASQTELQEAESEAVSSRHLVIMIGLPGDQTHRERFTEAAEKLIVASNETLSVDAEHLTVLAGDDEMQQALSVSHEDVGVCSGETVEQTLRDLASRLKPIDSLWVVMIGHSHPQGVLSEFNVLGRDFSQQDFSKWAAPIECFEQVFVLTQPISGFWIKPLAKPGRILLTATEADLEFTATEMPYALADVLAGESDQALDDVDGDGSVSLHDLYLATSIEVTLRFRSIDRLQTEHAQLDDNGDGRGSEVQLAYLPPEPTDDDEDEDEDEESEEENVDEETDDPDLDSTEAEQPNEQSDQPTDSVASGDEVRPSLPRPELVTSRNLDGFRSRYVPLKRDVKP
ncbi:hypothetical protein U8335_18405 [Roseiconus lacunae]|uniref:hypothetical protein n=1 Tax=Roseiconus lacunae TaxID=2605694 RepID=UPI003086FA31|nr:hypothetical protein U8335_18405 [Stieleria sp. HD01]